MANQPDRRTGVTRLLIALIAEDADLTHCPHCGPRRISCNEAIAVPAPSGISAYYCAECWSVCYEELAEEKHS